MNRLVGYGYRSGKEAKRSQCGEMGLEEAVRVRERLCVCVCVCVVVETAVHICRQSQRSCLNHAKQTLRKGKKHTTSPLLKSMQGQSGASKLLVDIKMFPLTPPIRTHTQRNAAYAHSPTANKAGQNKMTLSIHSTFCTTPSPPTLTPSLPPSLPALLPSSLALPQWLFSVRHYSGVSCITERCSEA
ncbi:unnamed protein product [Boreogadus saida]